VCVRLSERAVLVFGAPGAGREWVAAGAGQDGVRTASARLVNRQLTSQDASEQPSIAVAGLSRPGDGARQDRGPHRT
jgi:hypothetical protein